MLIILCPLAIEARPLITFFKLSAVKDLEPLRVYQSPNILLAVSGIGKIKAACVTSRLLGYVTRELKREVTACYLFGIAGARANSSQIGEVYLANSVCDAASSTKYYPHICYKHNFKECALFTVDKPVFRSEDFPKEADLVDMEASGFLAAALTFLDTAKVGVIRVVSDFGNGEFPDKQVVQKLLDEKSSFVSQYLQQILTDVVPGNIKHDESLWHNFEAQLVEKLQATFSQKETIKKHILYAQALELNALDFQEVLTIQCHSRQDSSKILQKLAQMLENVCNS